jgi:glycosyltransferase involved in cell wall biosynthesis
MTVLWVTFGLPYPPDSGVRLRDFHLIREASRSARILLFSLIPPGSADDAGELREFCDSVETWAMPSGLPPLRSLLRIPAGAWRNLFPAAAERIRAIALAERPDVVQIEHSLLAGYLDALPREIGCRSVLSLHNVAFEQYRRMAGLRGGVTDRIGYWLKSWIMRRTEMHYIPRFDLCLTVSSAESDLLARCLPGSRSVVIENGVDCTGLQPIPAESGSNVLFAGVMDYPPNADGAIFFCRSVLPLIRSFVPDVQVTIAGHSPPSPVKALADDEATRVTGRVDDIRPYYGRASVTIAPLRAGGGTRLKILESMALGRPVVSTSIGCEGLEVRNDVHLLIADGAEHFAECVTRLLQDPALRERIAQEARHRVVQRYDWKAIGNRLVAAWSNP